MAENETVEKSEKAKKNIAYHKIHYLKNKKEINEKHKKYYAENKEKVLAWQREYQKIKRPYLAKQQKEWRLKNIDKIKERSKKYYYSNKEKFKEKNKFNRIKVEYGITKEKYNEMVKLQNGKCAICFSVITDKTFNDTFRIDHNHKTGKVRALLCLTCNTLLGMAKENIEILKSSIEYLQRHNNE